MNCSNMLTDKTEPPRPVAERFDRLRRTRTLRNDAFARWRAAKIALLGCGHLGGKFGLETVRSGCSILACDKDLGEEANLATQTVEVGMPKAATLADACERIEPGRVETFVGDFRHIGIGLLAKCDLLVDCTDDAAWTAPLTRISNGLGIPLIRLAIDGSGEQDVGRVRVSHGGGGRACQLCTSSADDLTRHSGPMPCVGRPAPGAAPTITGNGIGMAIVGLGLLQAQRLIGQNDSELALDREVFIDLTNMQILSGQIRRAANCLSGHVRWELVGANKSAHTTTFRALFKMAAHRLGTGDVTLEPYGHPLHLAATCPTCHETRHAVGTAWSAPPVCRCGGATAWRPEVLLTRVSAEQTTRLGLDETPLSELGMPGRGAMFVARGRTRDSLHLVLD